MLHLSFRQQAAKDAPPQRRARVPDERAALGLLGLLTAWTVYYGATQYLALRTAASHTYQIWHARWAFAGQQNYRLLPRTELLKLTHAPL